MIICINGLATQSLFTVAYNIICNNFKGKKFFVQGTRECLDIKDWAFLQGGQPGEVQELQKYILSWNFFYTDYETSYQFGPKTQRNRKNFSEIFLNKKDNIVLGPFISREDYEFIRSQAGAGNVVLYNIVEEPSHAFNRAFTEEFLKNSNDRFAADDEENSYADCVLDMLNMYLNAIDLKEYNLYRLEDLVKGVTLPYFGRDVQIFPDGYLYEYPEENQMSDDWEFAIEHCGVDVYKELGYPKDDS